jgi:hypothetical protein
MHTQCRNLSTQQLRMRVENGQVETQDSRLNVNEWEEMEGKKERNEQAKLRRI